MAILLAVGVCTALASGIRGECVECHTMHNSEQGAPVAVQGLNGEPSGTPNTKLLRHDCMACHAQNSGVRVVTLAGGSSIPQVYHTDSSDLAAGNFAYVSGTKAGHAGTSGNRKGHNVVDLLDAESDMSHPPGYRHDTAGVNTGRFELDKFTCAGAMGCHGFRGQAISVVTVDDEGQECDPEFAICDENDESGGVVFRTGLAALSGFDGSGTNIVLNRGAHHDNFDGLKHGNPLTDNKFYDNPLARSYRFIRALRGYGNEVDRWQNIDADSHNEYSGGYADTALGDLLEGTDFGAATCTRCHVGGQAGTTSRLTTPGQSITGFCVTCHGTFHSSGVTSGTMQNGTSGAFLRHPSDHVIPDRGEYAAYTIYDITAPVARPTDFFSVGMAADPTVRPGTDLVMCLSCHMAHASPYDGMLRFDYAAMVAGNYASSELAQAQGGCLACHSTKGVLLQNR